MLQVLKIALYIPKFSLTVFSCVCFVLPGTFWEAKAVSAPNQLLFQDTFVIPPAVLSSCSSARVILSCPSEPGTPSTFLIRSV